MQALPLFIGLDYFLVCSSSKINSAPPFSLAGSPASKREQNVRFKYRQVSNYRTVCTGL